MQLSEESSNPNSAPIYMIDLSKDTLSLEEKRVLVDLLLAWDRGKDFIVFRNKNNENERQKYCVSEKNIFLSHTVLKRETINHKNKNKEFRFHIIEEEELGAGMMGRVVKSFRQFKIKEGKIYLKYKKFACKISDSIDEEGKSQDEKEWVITQELHGAKESVSVDEKAYFLMTELPGKTLDKIDFKQWSLVARLDLIIDILKELRLIRNKGYIHRDIKPQNILYDEKTKKVYIIDFGLSRFRSNNNGCAGTLEYMSPECTDENPQATTKSDLYACAGIFGRILGDETVIKNKEAKKEELASELSFLVNKLNDICNEAKSEEDENKLFLLHYQYTSTTEEILLKRKEITETPFDFSSLFSDKVIRDGDTFWEEMEIKNLLESMSEIDPKSRPSLQAVLDTFIAIRQELPEKNDIRKKVKTEKTDKEEVFNLINKRIKKLREWSFVNINGDAKVLMLEDLMREIDHPRNADKTLNKIIENWEKDNIYVMNKGERASVERKIVIGAHRNFLFSEKRGSFTATYNLIQDLKTKYGDKVLNPSDLGAEKITYKPMSPS